MSSGSSEGVSEGIAFRSMFSFLQRKGKAAGYKLHKMCHDKGLRNFLFSQTGFPNHIGLLIYKRPHTGSSLLSCPWRCVLPRLFLLERNLNANSCSSLSLSFSRTRRAVLGVGRASACAGKLTGFQCSVAGLAGLTVVRRRRPRRSLRCAASPIRRR